LRLPMPRNNYYLHKPNGQSSLVELCDKDGNVLARIMPQGSATHRDVVVSLFEAMLIALEEGI